VYLGAGALDDVVVAAAAAVVVGHLASWGQEGEGLGIPSSGGGVGFLVSGLVVNLKASPAVYALLFWPDIADRSSLPYFHRALGPLIVGCVIVVVTWSWRSLFIAL
jgi:hypothetical protein